MFSIFKKAATEQDVVLQELNEDELSQVAGGHAHKHHHKHHKHHHKQHKHHMMTPPQKMMPTTTPTTTTTTTGTQVIHQHW
ncbi:MAG TPA: hypothetical protein VFB60_09210 [Ktedonobacteraceae bacterium]|nr:hypothetical protein [Ktedonobacteraceae bacterium]